MEDCIPPQSLIYPRSSIFHPRFLPIALPADHVHHAECRHNIGDHVTFDHFVKRSHGDKARRAHADAVGPAAAVADDVEAQFAVAAFDREVSFTGGNMDPFHDDLEMMHQPFDAAVNFFFLRQDEARVFDPYRPHRQVRQCLLDDLHALLDLTDAAKEPVVVITPTAHRHLEIEPVINQIGKSLAYVVIDASGTQDRPGEAIAQRGFLGNNADVRHAVEKNPVTRKQTIAIVEQLADGLKGPGYALGKVVRQVVFQATDAHISHGEARAG